MFSRVPWPNLYSMLARTWEQSQHAIVMAPTGSGKTVLIQELMRLRSSVVFFGTKIRDDEYDRIVDKLRYRRIYTWPPHRWQTDRVMLWPEAERTIRETVAKQKDVFRNAFDGLFRKGKWTAVLDELHWMTNDLGLYDEIASLHHQGRSSKLTFIDGFQRPAFVPRIVYSSATHVFAWGTNDPKDLSSLGAITGIPVRQWQETMPHLGVHDFVYVNMRDRKIPPVISQVER
jgi:hypothetical protein